VDSGPIEEPREVILTRGAVRGLTVLEGARACAIAGVRATESDALMRRLLRGEGDPDELLRATELMYACALMLERRRDPSLSWDEAQRWRVVFDVDADDSIADAEAEASVAAALATGLPPDVAGQLTLAQTEAYAAAGASSRRT